VDTYRTFIAIELPSNIRQSIKQHIDQLRAVFPGVRASWTREDNLHLTLKFLGNVPVERIPALSNAVTAAAHEIKPFDLAICDCGIFPPHGRPKVLWIGCANVPPASHSRDAESTGFQPASSTSPLPLALSSVHAALEDRCAAAGFAREPRSFHPHLTIARLRESKGSRALAEHHKHLGFAAQTFTVSELVVFRSELSSKGSKHTALARHELG
jgi:2'-5' RNA ligase